MESEKKIREFIGKKVWAIRKKTYPDEDDMQRYCNGELDEPSDVKVFHKGRKYLVAKEHVDEEYYTLIDSVK